MKKFWLYVVLSLEIIFLIIFCIFTVLNFQTRDHKNAVPSASPSANAGNDPSGEGAAPTAAPSATPAPPVTATLVSAGDCVLHKVFQLSALKEGEDRYDFNSIFEAVRPYTESADYSLISFESAATNKRNDYTGYPLFNCPPEIFGAFKSVGFDLVNNSNNHQLDRKVVGMLETMDNIHKAGLEVLGVYDGEEPRYIVKDLNGIKVGLMAYTYGCNLNEDALTEEERFRHLALIDEERMKKEITEMEEKDDITVIAIHWGTEYTQKPTEYQKKLAHEMITWGADVILGSHPHVVQPSEIVKHNGHDKYIIYSMGNFVSNQRRGASGYPKTHKELCEDSMLVDIEFCHDPGTQSTVINSVKHIPTWLWRYTDNGRYRFKVIPVPAPGFYKNSEYPEEILAEAYESYARTMRLVTDYERR